MMIEFKLYLTFNIAVKIALEDIEFKHVMPDIWNNSRKIYCFDLLNP